MFIDRLLELAGKNKSLFTYFYISVIVTIVDVLIVWVLRNGFGLGIVEANTAGVVSGSILQYFLVSRHVFYVEYGIPGVMVFFGTFLFGLVLADWIIWLSSEFLLEALDKNLNLLVSKGFSIAIPFFILYGLRRFLFGLLKKRNEGAV